MDHDRKGWVSIFKLTAIASTMLGVQFAWSIQIGQITPLLRVLGVHETLIGLSWLAGPISGMIVQPIVGIWSDRCESKYGRRRPFIAVGAVCVSLALLLISHSREFENLFYSSKEHSHGVAITMSLLGFWLLDLSNNMIQGPARALVADIAPASQQSNGMALVAAMLAFGNFFGYLIGYNDSAIVEAFPFFGTPIRALFTIGAMVMLIFTGITVFGVKEKPFNQSLALGDEENNRPTGSRSVHSATSSNRRNPRNPNPEPYSDISEEEDEEEEEYSYDEEDEDIDERRESQVLLESATSNRYSRARYTTAPPPSSSYLSHLQYHVNSLNRTMKQTCVVSSCISFGWFAFFMFISEWVAEDVFGGDSQADPKSDEYKAFDEGVRFGSLGLAYSALVTLFFSFMIPYFVSYLGERGVLAAGQVVFFLCTFSTIYIHSKTATLVMLALTGIPWATFLVIPFSIVTKYCTDGSNRGIYLAIFNLSVVIPQLFLAIISGPFLGIFPNLDIILATGGVVGLVGAWMAFSIDLPQQRRRNSHLDML